MITNETLMENLHRCFRCGYCKYTEDYLHYNCPAYEKHRSESHAPGGMLWLIRAMMTGEIEASRQLARNLYSCTLCLNCVKKCPIPFNTRIVDMLVAGRSHLVDRGVVPKPVNDYLTHVYKHGNPWKRKRRTRGEWADAPALREYRETDDHLFYVGDLGSYDPRAREVTKAVGEALARAGLGFGILGEAELSDGNDARGMGETELFRHLAEKNAATMEEMRVNSVITLSPHAYNAMRNDYPFPDKGVSVHHYTQVLARAVGTGDLTFTRPVRRKVTYHDPCFLGRWNGEYEAPRTVLKAIPGIDLVEMDRSGEDALCCGGGGGNFYTDVLGSGRRSPAAIRVREARDTGAEILALACPGCMVMFEDAVKTENLEDDLTVMDISELVAEAV